jgi:predicted AAA+ superfamily ATPase
MLLRFADLGDANSAKYPPGNSAKYPPGNSAKYPPELTVLPLGTTMARAGLSAKVFSREQDVAYLARVIDGELEESLQSIGAVVIEGPRACGKTETARQAAKSEVRLDVDATARQAFAIDPSLALAGPVPRLIDEWQVDENVWDHVRRAVDERGKTGQFILTGSSVPRDNARRHTGAGRFIHLRMRPMTMSEVGHSINTISFAKVVAGEPASSAEPSLTVPDLADRLAIGGWPGYLRLNPMQAQRAMRGYLEDICNVDVQRLDEVRRDPRSVKRLIQSLARNIGCPVTVESLTKDANGKDGAMKVETVRRYLDVLSRLMITDDVTAWDPAMRSRTRLRAASIRHLADPALAIAAQGSSPGRLLKDLKWFGFLFESMVVRDLRVYAQAVGAQVFHYHDEDDLEVDAIVEMPDGGWAAFEIKLGAVPSIVDAAAANLLNLRRKVGTPALALAVITGKGYGIVREDGVLQIPIGALCA